MVQIVVGARPAMLISLDLLVLLLSPYFSLFRGVLSCDFFPSKIIILRVLYYDVTGKRRGGKAVSFST